MLGSLFSAPLPDKAIEYAGFVLVHCVAIADENREGELICPFAVLTGKDGRHVVNFESETQDEAVSKGWASLSEAKASKLSWAFGREGIYRDPDGKGRDVFTVTVWMPAMKSHYSVLQRFGRQQEQTVYLIGSPEVIKHEADSAEPVQNWNEKALLRGIASHRQGSRWSSWRAQ